VTLARVHFHIRAREVIKGLILHLEKLTEERKEEEKAKTTFHTLFRLMFVEKGGRPKYPEFSWAVAETFLSRYKDDTWLPNERAHLLARGVNYLPGFLIIFTWVLRA
jgi:hypothetical protein